MRVFLRNDFFKLELFLFAFFPVGRAKIVGKLKKTFQSDFTVGGRIRHIEFSVIYFHASKDMY